MEEKKNLTEAEKDATITRLQAELGMALAFNKVAVAERNLAWAREATLKAEVEQGKLIMQSIIDSLKGACPVCKRVATGQHFAGCSIPMAVEFCGTGRTE